MPEVRHRQHNINSGFIQIITDTNTYVPAFWAHPMIGGPFPGLVLLHDDWGLEANARAMANRFAEAGYYVIVPDLFEGQHANNQIEADALEIRYKALAPPKVVAGIAALATHPKCNRKLAVVGWDLGADLAMQLAIEHQDIMAAVAVSGNPSSLFGKTTQIQAPLLVIMGEDDIIAKNSAVQAKQELCENNDKNEVIVYPNVAHAFYNYLSIDYKPEVAEAAWQYVLTFLETHQGKPPAPQETKPGQFRPGRVY